MPDDKLYGMQKKLGVTRLGDTDKKEMFNKFVKAGGQVVDLEKAEREKRLVEQRSRMEQSPQKREQVYERPRRPEHREEERKPAPMSRPAAKPVESGFSLWLERFTSRLSCFFSGITAFGGKEFQPAFHEFVLINYQNTLLNSRMVLASILYQDRLVAAEIKKRMIADSLQPFAFELIQRFDALYDEQVFQALLVMKNSVQSVKSAKEMVLRLFKGLYILQPYAFQFKSAVEKALSIERDIRRLDPNVTSANLKRISANADFVFQKVYPKLFLLAEMYYHTDPARLKTNFRDFCGVVEEDSVGMLTARWKEEIEQQLRSEEAARRSALAAQTRGEGAGSDQPGGETLPGEQSSDNPDDPVRLGLRLIEQNIRFRAIRKSYIENKDPRGLFTVSDKIFLSYVLIDFFDKEYSFLFNSNRVAFNIAFQSGAKLDLKRELVDNYYKINNIYERTNAYLKILRDIRKVDKDAFMKQDEKTTRYNQCSIQRSQLSRAIRKDARELFEEFSRRFLFIVNDLRSLGKVVQNAEDILDFNKKVDGSRVIDGKTIRAAMEEVYYFCSALHFLFTDGDLGGMTLAIEKPLYLKIEQAEPSDSAEVEL
jgi:hypothetical protein